MSKQPASHQTHASPLPLQTLFPLKWSPGSIMAAIKSFPNGSAGGADRLKLQYMKDMVEEVEIAEYCQS